MFKKDHPTFMDFEFDTNKNDNTSQYSLGLIIVFEGRNGVEDFRYVESENNGCNFYSWISEKFHKNNGVVCDELPVDKESKNLEDSDYLYMD